VYETFAVLTLTAMAVASPFIGDAQLTANDPLASQVVVPFVSSVATLTIPSAITHRLVERTTDARRNHHTY
jgi:hypothetical protein